MKPPCMTNVCQFLKECIHVEASGLPSYLVHKLNAQSQMIIWHEKQNQHHDDH